MRGGGDVPPSSASSTMPPGAAYSYICFTSAAESLMACARLRAWMRSNVFFCWNVHGCSASSTYIYFALNFQDPPAAPPANYQVHIEER